jgi:hypothetical protein
MGVIHDLWGAGATVPVALFSKVLSDINVGCGA